MSYHHANVALFPGQINKLKSKQASASGTSITLKHGHLSGGQNKLSVTQTQLNQINKARSTGKGIRLYFTTTAVGDMIKSGGIFPFLSALSALISAAAQAVAKAAALGAVGNAAGMALQKVTGKGYNKRGGNISQIPLFAARGGKKAVKPILDAALGAISRHNVGGPMGTIVSLLQQVSKSGSGYKKKKGHGLRLPGTPASWYPNH